MNFMPRWSRLPAAILRLGLAGGLLLATVLPLGDPPRAQARDDGLARTPPMGWNDYYSFGCDPTEQFIMEVADAMVQNGMQAAGYEYVNIDDCWAAESRDAQGNLVPDSIKFPRGIAFLADYVHARGLKLGIYTDVGTHTCSGRPGSLGFEWQDAQTFADWGVDFIKADWCYTESLDAQEAYGRLSAAIAATGRPMVLSICNWGEQSPWLWGPTMGHMWRTYHDISWYKDTPQFQTEDHWYDVVRNLNKNSAYAEYAGPGGWNDPDILQVGLGTLTPTEEQAHISLWAIMAAPLLAGNDVRTMSPETLALLTNPEVIAVDQDPMGIQGIKVRDDAGLQVWAKPIDGAGVRAAALFNTREQSATMTVHWADVSLAPGMATVRDLWARSDRGVYRDGYSAVVPAHGVVLLKVQGTEGRAAPRLSISTVPLFPASTVDNAVIGEVPWEEVWNANTLNSLYATAPLRDESSHYLQATAFPLGIPSNATVQGITVVIRRGSEAGRNTDDSIRLLSLWTPVGLDRANPLVPWPRAPATVAYGGRNDRWGIPWRPDLINNDGFGVAIASRNDAAAGGPDISYVDGIGIMVQYTVPGLTPLAASEQRHAAPGGR